MGLLSLAVGVPDTISEAWWWAVDTITAYPDLRRVVRIRECEGGALRSGGRESALCVRAGTEYCPIIPFATILGDCGASNDRVLIADRRGDRRAVR